MNRLLSILIDKNTPKVNPYVMRGLACYAMQNAEEYIDRVFRSASKSFPEGLEYLGYERCTPEEEYMEHTKVKNNKRTYDLARSDFYLVKYKFAFKGEAIPNRYVYLPYVNEGGTLCIGGPMFHITPVLSDKVISPGSDNIFVRLLRDKIIFKRCYHSLIIDNVRETTHVIWSQIYRKSKDNKKVPNTTKAYTCLVHYLFAKYGFNDTFLKYAGFKPVIGEGEITTDNYPADKWIICESCQVKPKTFMGEFYEPTKIRLAIPRELWSPITKALVTGFFYIVDHFPSRFRPGYVDNQTLWKILLGHIIFSGLYGENKLFTQINEHFTSLDSYVDSIVIDKLRENNYHIENFYDLLSLILAQFNNLVLNNESSNLSMYGKSLEVLYYVLYPITSGIFQINFLLSKAASKKPLIMKDVVETFNKNMKMGAIFRLSSSSVIAESVSYSGDHLYPKLTSKITEQESRPGGTKGKSKRTVVGEDQHIDISMVEAGSILFLSKSNPTPTNHINPFVNLDLVTGTVMPNPKFEAIRAKTQKLLSHHIEPSSRNNIEDLETDHDEL